MRARLVFGCAAAGVVLPLFGVAYASAESAFAGSIAFSSDVARPGERVDVIGSCDDPAFTTTPIVSAILDAPDLGLHDDGAGGRVGTSFAAVKKDAKPGRWPVSFTCGTTTVTGHLWVAGTAKPGVRTIPEQARAGQEITVRVDCENAVPVTSAALTVGPLTEGEGRPDERHFIGNAKVDNVKPGAYPVNAKCDGKPLSATFTVLGASSADAAVKATDPPETGAPSPAETGARESQPADDAPDHTAPILLGGAAAVLVASAGVGGWLYRRRRW